MQTELNKTKDREIKTLAEIYIEEFSKPPYKEKWTLKKATEKIKIFKNLYDCYTIFYGKNIIGFIAVNPTFMCPGVVAFGEDIVIKKEFQGKGLSTLVFNKIFQIYKKRSFKYFMGIAHKKSKALKIYKRKGFSIDKDFVLIGKRIK